MLLRLRKTVPVLWTSDIHLSGLLQQKEIEFLYVLLRPLDASRLHRRREASLIDVDRVAYQCKDDERDFVKVLAEIALVHTLAITCLSVRSTWRHRMPKRT